MNDKLAVKTAKILTIMKAVIKLKKLKRSGWVEKNIKNPESIADHSFGVALLANCIDLPNQVKREKLVNMVLIHDIGAAEIGDIIWKQE